MKNHLGERVFQTYPAWRRAVREICPILSIGGDKDIATVPGVGEWDGETGVIYNTSPESKMESLILNLKIALADARRCFELCEATSNGKLPERGYQDILEEIEKEFPHPGKS